MPWFKISNLFAGTENKLILSDFNLQINPGEVHAIMGPNGTGKSSLANVIAGNPKYSVSSGNILFKDIDILPLPPEQRASMGIFLGFQNPIDIPGVSVMTFLKYAINAQRAFNSLEPLDAPSLLKKVKIRAEALGIPNEMLKRPLNVGFSGGEKKRIETLQMALLEPELAILDEMDSGLDIDALKIVANGINVLKNNNRSFLLITHYDRLLSYVKPNFVHIMVNGKIVRSGNENLAKSLEKNGYTEFLNA